MTIRPTLQHLLPGALGALALISLASPLRANDSAEIRELRNEIQALEQKLKITERKQEVRDEVAATAAKAAAKITPKVANGDSGLVVTSGDGANTFHAGAVVQLDSREFFNDGGGVANNGFILRRARLVLDGKLGKTYAYQFVPEFGNGSGGTANAVGILDANVTIAPTQAVQFKFGKYKTPIGLEELQKDVSTQFAERTLVSDLLPNRDLGASIGGTLGGGTVTYIAGIFNGISDNTTLSGNSDFDNDKDFDGQIFLTPFINAKDSPLQGLGFGVGGGIGREKTHAAATSGYRTDGQQTFFTYNSAVYADGKVWRLSPQANYYGGPLGVMAEYAISTINLRPSAPTATVVPPKVQVENKAWEVTGSYVLTGEDVSYNGVTPKAPFNWSARTWGAWQILARYADLKIDPSAFRGPTPLASPSTNASRASAFGLGLNWYLSKTVRISQDFFSTRFTVNTPTAATPQILQHDERVLTTRVQFSF